MDYFIWLYRSSTWDAPPSRSWASPAVHLSLRRIHIPGTAAQQRLAVLVAEHIVWRAVVLQLNSGRGPQFWGKYWETNWQKYWETWENLAKHQENYWETWETNGWTWCSPVWTMGMYMDVSKALQTYIARFLGKSIYIYTSCFHLHKGTRLLTLICRIKKRSVAHTHTYIYIHKYIIEYI